MTAAVQQVRPLPVSGHLHHAFETRTRELTVVSAETLTPEITHFVFADPAGRTLTSYEPGSHLIIQAGDKRNAYSLTGDGVNPRHYEISVLRHDTGGGSEWLHANVRVGGTVLVEGPRSMFAPNPVAKKLLLIAAGIGVTPALSHARAAVRWGRPVEVLYVYRPGSGAHVAELRALAASSSLELHEAHGREPGLELIRHRLHHQPLGTHAYACGPTDMLESYLAIGREEGWHAGRLHLERFQAPAQEPGDAFTARVISTGQTLMVEPGVSLLEVLLDAGLEVPNLCRQGVCGECRIPVRARTIEHRDHVLSDEEKSASSAMLCCVSRGQEIEVDL
jgi:ferredoxin-NADP reductase